MVSAPGGFTLWETLKIFSMWERLVVGTFRNQLLESNDDCLVHGNKACMLKTEA